MIAKTLTQADLASLVADLVAAGTRVVAPRKRGAERADYRPIARLEEADLGGALPSRSLKEFFLPTTEVLLRWKQRKAEVAIEEVPTEFGPTVVLGARPCDAAGVEILDKVMGWDYRDELWFGRRQATTIVSLACPGVDASCFCSAVGLAPDSRKGADVLLVPVDGGYLAEAHTAKGEALLGKTGAPVDAQGKAQAGAAGQAERYRATANAKVAANLKADPASLSRWIAAHFEHPFWSTLAQRCHGCGACASVCPTCHCFDIVDEPRGIGAGERRRNWDTCQTGKFTIHASGHNPRAGQNERFRQRVNHKFAIYPSKFGETLCTGCGRCARACPAGMDLPEILRQLTELSGGAR